MKLGRIDKIGDAQATGDVIYFDGTEWKPDNGVGFKAYRSTDLSVPDNTVTDLGCDTEYFDTHGWYDVSTFRFTPQLAGYYIAISWWYMVNDAAWSDDTRIIGNIRAEKATDELVQWRVNSNTHRTNFHQNGMAVFITYLNGSTDYIWAYAYQSQFGASTEIGRNASFMAALLR